MTPLVTVGAASKGPFDDNGSNPEEEGAEKRPRGTLRGCDGCVTSVIVVFLGVGGSLIPAAGLDGTEVWFRIGDNGLSSGDVIAVEKDAVEEIEDDVVAEPGC